MLGNNIQTLHQNQAITLVNSRLGKKSFDNQSYSDSLAKREVKAATEKLQNLAQESSRVLIDIRTVFPFTIFPDELIVDETKISVHTNYFFLSKEIRSVEYRDIFNVIVQQGFFFATLEITDRFFAKDPLKIRYLKKSEAVKARRIIQGLIIAKKEDIDIGALSVEDLQIKLERIGQSR